MFNVRVSSIVLHARDGIEIVKTDRHAISDRFHRTVFVMSAETVFVLLCASEMEGLTMKFIYFVGTAGSGKSTLVRAYKEWLDYNGIDAAVVNLDPGVDTIPYTADIDIREWVALSEVMDEYSLGPNGAQVVAADLMAVNVEKLTKAIDEVKTKYMLIDTPGQLELFAFRKSSNIIVDALGKDDSLVVYLSDPMLCKDSNGFISSLVLSSLVQFRLQLPILNVLTKSDILKEEEIERITTWFTDPYSLYGDLLDHDENPQTVVGMELYKALENVGVFGEMRSVSATEGLGMEEIYAMTQLAFFGGEDPDRDSNADADTDSE